jgi:hypothetical protein
MPSEEIMSREAMKLALEALESDPTSLAWLINKKQAIAALRQALGTEQEPVAWASSLDFDDDDQEIIPAKDKGKLGTNNCDIPLYAAPPRHDYVIDCPRCGHCCAERTWVELTDEEIQNFSYRSQKIDVSNTVWFDRLGFAKAIEQALKEKNT